jgi:outer membrane lipase/esterase
MNFANFKCAGAVITASMVAASSPAASQTISQFIGFGDSTIDSGWYRNAAPNSTNPIYNADFAIAVTQGGGKATTNPGLVSSEFLAGAFGQTAIPANQPGGTNYATGDARNAQTNVGVPNSLQGAVPTVTQINNYLAANNGVANAAALYLISSGGNDISYAAGNLPSAARTPYVIAAANDLVAGIAKLAAAGARIIVVPNQPQPFGGATLEALRTAYDNALWGGLAAARVNFIPADINAVFRAFTFNLPAFGLISGAGPACTQPAGIPSGWATMCSATSTVSTLVSPAAQQTHLFADDIRLRDVLRRARPGQCELLWRTARRQRRLEYLGDDPQSVQIIAPATTRRRPRTTNTSHCRHVGNAIIFLCSSSSAFDKLPTIFGGAIPSSPK